MFTLSIYIYIYPPAPACQGPPCEGWLSITDLLSNSFSNIPSSVYQSSSTSIGKSAVHQSAGDQSAVCRSAGQQSGLSTVLLYPLDTHFTPQPGGCSQLWVVLKINEISMNFQYPPNHQNCLPRPPKVTKTRSQELPKVVKISKVLKK